MAELDFELLQHRMRHRFRRPEILALALVHRSFLNEARSPRIESNERLEFLGDAVIGFAIARELFGRFPDAPEGQLTEFRAHLVRWETLADVGRRLDLGAFLRMGRGEERSGGRDRSLNLARGFEAVVGAVLEESGVPDAERFVLRMLQPELDSLEAHTNVADVKSRLQEWSQAKLGTMPNYLTTSVDGPDHARVFQVEVRIGDVLLGTGSGRNKRSAERAAASEALQRLTTDER